MKIDYLKTLTAVERMLQFVYYLENRNLYTTADRKKLDRYFEDF
ncbi:hypothetical protein SAMN04487764_1543 [Gillisia sp. Hel1_33_143]|nr:hypothetical protein [Gillisia sp. Hel1_33_143]SDS14032.1 hypothetical protein SAMN04487764_1543 [Gillisia sp. Hel1_33_143]